MATENQNGSDLQSVGPALSALERRAKYLQNQLLDWRGSDSGRQFARDELEGIEKGIAALKLHRAELEGMSEPIGALRTLIEAVDSLGNMGVAGIELRAAVKRARLALEEFGALEDPD